MILADGRLTQKGMGAAPTDHICTPRLAGAWGMWVVGGCARVVPVCPPPPSLLHNLMQSLHLKYTWGKPAVSNSSSLYTLFYCVIYNSVDFGVFNRLLFDQQSLPSTYILYSTYVYGNMVIIIVSVHSNHSNIEMKYITIWMYCVQVLFTT